VIKLPDAIVIYPQKKRVPSYLLCWIPAKEYQGVVRSSKKRDELARLYPNGVEVELSQDGLKDAGISLRIKPTQLKRAYLELLAEGLIPETGVVELGSLKAYLDEKRGRSRKELTAELKEKRGRLDELEEGDLLRKITSPPPMTKGEEAEKIYRRLDVNQRKSDMGEQRD